MKPILEIHNLSKKYSIRHESLPYLTLRERFSKGFTARSKQEEFWALRNVDVEVHPGDSLGIIGRNGAGKSTLLKILSKITPPSEGRIVSRGRIASLLEVGTGFHPELTGRENVYLNGSILGMKKREIDSKFDEIIDFAGTEKFLDTALKHYSSGMQLRLAFAVAAFLEPEILIIDEVLAVGDAEFQKKCLAKMEHVSKGGRTILFVSHDLGIIRQLCKKGILLDKGKLVEFNSMNAVVDLYRRTISKSKNYLLNKEINSIILDEVTVRDQVGTEAGSVSFNNPWSIELKVSFKERFDNLCVAVGLLDLDDRSIRTYWHNPVTFSPGSVVITFTENKLIMAEGTYRLVFGFSFKNQAHAYFDEGIYFEIMRTDVSTTAFETHFFAKTDFSTGVVYNPFEVTIR